MKNLLAIMAAAVCLHANGQNLMRPDNVFVGVKLIGQINMYENGQLFISQAENPSKIKLIKLNLDLATAWETIIDNPKLKGYNFNDVMVLHDQQQIYWVSKTSSVNLLVLSQADGSVSKESRKIKTKVLENERIDKMFVDLGGNLVSLRNKEGNVGLASLGSTDNKLRFNTVKKINQDPYFVNFATAFTRNDYITSYSYSLNANHSKMKLHLYLLDKKGKVLSEKESELNLDFHSFTYNSSFNSNVMNFYPTSSGFYIMGKLDLQYKRRYPSKKAGESFNGLWIAKFNQSFELEYFNEYSFHYFQGLILNNVIHKPAIVDLKEDLNGGLFVNINEVPGAVYGKKYVMFLDKNGVFRNFVGGNDSYNFFEYERNGVRAPARKTKVRIGNDDWRYYNTNYLNQVKYSPKHHSYLLKVIKDLSTSKKNIILEKKAYNYVLHSQSQDYVFEYLKKNGGTLNCYLIPKMRLALEKH